MKMDLSEQLSIRQKRVDEMALKISSMQNSEKAKEDEIEKLRAEFNKMRLNDESKFSKIIEELEKERLNLTREITRTQVSKNTVFIKKGCSGTTAKGNPCKNTVNCPHHEN